MLGGKVALEKQKLFVKSLVYQQSGSEERQNRETPLHRGEGPSKEERVEHIVSAKFPPSNTVFKEGVGAERGELQDSP